MYKYNIGKMDPKRELWVNRVIALFFYIILVYILFQLITHSL